MPARWCCTASCSPRSGAPNTATTCSTCGSGSAACDESWVRRRASRDRSSPSRGSDTCSMSTRPSPSRLRTSRSRSGRRLRQAMAEGILVMLEALLVPRGDDPVALEEAPGALRRAAWIGRPVVIAGSEVRGRQLPAEPTEREAWVRSILGPGPFAVVPFEQPRTERGTDDGERAAEQWRTLREGHGANWLVA